MKKNLPQLGTTIMALFALALIPGCKPGIKAKEGDTVIVIKQREGEMLAKVGKRVITLEEAKEDFLSRQGTFKGAPNLNTSKAQNDYIDNQVIQEAMFQEAIAKGYFERPDVVRDVRKIVVQRLVRDELEKSQTNYVPTEEQIKEHYNKNLNLYNRDEAIKVAYVRIPFGEKKEAAKTLATAIQKDALTIQNGNTREFSRLAMKFAPKINPADKISIETNETDYLEKPAFEGKFGSGVFDSVKGLEVIGKVAPLVTTNDAYVVLMKTGYRKQLSETLDNKDTQEKISKRLAYEHRGEAHKVMVERLKKDYGIEVNRDLLPELSKGVEPPEQVAKAAANVFNEAKAALNNEGTPPAAQGAQKGDGKNH